MKVKFLPSVLFLSLASLFWSPVCILAQGLSPTELVDPSHSELNLNEDKTLLVDHESKSKPAGRDSIQQHGKSSQVILPGTKSKASEHKPMTSDDQDDALSFNFLYYIIQKFKISDLVDE